MLETEELDYEFSSSESDEECKKNIFKVKGTFSWRHCLRKKRKICSRDNIFILNCNNSKSRHKPIGIKAAFDAQKEIHDSNFTIIHDNHEGQDIFRGSSSNRLATDAKSDNDDFAFSIINTDIPETNHDFPITAYAEDTAEESKERQSCIFSDVCPHYFLSTSCETIKCPLLHTFPSDRLDWYDFDTVLDEYSWIKIQPVLSKVFSVFLKYFIAHGNKDLLVDLFEDVSDDTNAHYLTEIIDGLVTLGMQQVDAVNLAIHQTRPIGHANYILLNYLIQKNLISVRLLEHLIGLREEPLPMQFVGNLINLYISHHSSNVELGLYIKTRVFDVLDKSDVRKFPPFCINAFTKILNKHLQN